MNAVLQMVIRTLMKTLLVVYVVGWLVVVFTARNPCKCEYGSPDMEPPGVVFQEWTTRNQSYVSAGLVLLLGVNLFLHFKRRSKITTQK